MYGGAREAAARATDFYNDDLIQPDDAPWSSLLWPFWSNRRCGVYADGEELKSVRRVVVRCRINSSCALALQGLPVQTRNYHPENSRSRRASKGRKRPATNLIDFTYQWTAKGRLNDPLSNTPNRADKYLNDSLKHLLGELGIN